MSLDKKVVRVGPDAVTLFVWDTAGQEKFFALTKAYFKKADGVLIVFDLGSRASFERTRGSTQASRSTGWTRSARRAARTA